MRIAVYHNLPSGGGKRTLQEQVIRLGEKHQIDVYSLSSANHEFADLRPYVTCHQVYPFTPLPLFNSPLGRLNNFIRLVDLMNLRKLSYIIAKKIMRGNYDVVLVHPCQFEAASSVLRYLNGIPSVYYCQEPLREMYEAMPRRPYDQDELAHRVILNMVDPLLALFKEYRRRNDRTNTRKAYRVLVNSKFMQAAVRSIYSINAQVSYHGVNVEIFHPMDLEKRNIVLSVGSLTPLKGFDFLIRAMAELPGENRPRLVIASNFQNPPERNYLETLAAELAVELGLLGNVSDLQLVNLYNQAIITLYAPIREPFGLVPLESMACGTPVVAVRDGGMQETILEGETGFLVERDVRQFAGAIHRLLSDPELARAFGRKGREHISNNWTWEVAIAKLEEYLVS